MKIVQSDSKIKKQKKLHPIRRILFHLGYVLFIIGISGSIEFDLLPHINQYYYWGMALVGFLLFTFNLSEQHITDTDISILRNKE